MTGGTGPRTRVPEELVRWLERRGLDDAPSDGVRMTLLLELLGRPDRSYPSIGVAGGHGKSSVVAMVAALFGALGLKAGSLTVPHLQDVRERLRIAGDPVPADDVTRLFSELEPYVAEVDARSSSPLTGAEVLAGMALAGLADAPVDVAVVEVRPDAPAALVRPEVRVVSDASGPELQDADGSPIIVRRDRAPGTGHPRAPAGAGTPSVVRLGPDFDVTYRELAVGGQMLTLRGVTGDVEEVYLPVLGRHQADNAAVALATVEGFLGFAGGIDPDVIRTGLAAVRLPGRLEVVRREHRCPVILDAASDAGSAAVLADALTSEFAVRHRVLVLAPTDDGGGDLARALAPVADHLVVTAAADEVEALASERDLTYEVAADLADALELASGVATAEDAVVVAGSAQVVGRARDLLGLPVS